MGNIGRRVGRLEDYSRELAVRKIKDLFDDLTDREVILELLRFEGASPSAELEREGMLVEAKLKASGIEGLLNLAVRPEECATEGEIDRRIREVVAEAIFAEGRLARLRILKRDLREGIDMKV